MANNEERKSILELVLLAMGNWDNKDISDQCGVTVEEVESIEETGVSPLLFDVGFLKKLGEIADNGVTYTDMLNAMVNDAENSRQREQSLSELKYREAKKKAQAELSAIEKSKEKPDEKNRDTVAIVGRQAPTPEKKPEEEVVKQEKKGFEPMEDSCYDFLPPSIRNSEHFTEWMNSKQRGPMIEISAVKLQNAIRKALGFESRAAFLARTNGVVLQSTLSKYLTGKMTVLPSRASTEAIVRASNGRITLKDILVCIKDYDAAETVLPPEYKDNAIYVAWAKGKPLEKRICVRRDAFTRLIDDIKSEYRNFASYCSYIGLPTKTVYQATNSRYLPDVKTLDKLCGNGKKATIADFLRISYIEGADEEQSEKIKVTFKAQTEKKPESAQPPIKTSEPPVDMTRPDVVSAVKEKAEAKKKEEDNVKAENQGTAASGENIKYNLKMKTQDDGALDIMLPISLFTRGVNISSDGNSVTIRFDR